MSRRIRADALVASGHRPDRNFFWWKQNNRNFSLCVLPRVVSHTERSISLKVFPSLPLSNRCGFTALRFALSLHGMTQLKNFTRETFISIKLFRPLFANFTSRAFLQPFALPNHSLLIRSIVYRCCLQLNLSPPHPLGIESKLWKMKVMSMVDGRGKKFLSNKNHDLSFLPISMDRKL